MKNANQQLLACAVGLQGPEPPDGRACRAERDPSRLGGGHTIDRDPGDLPYEGAEAREHCGPP